MLHFEILTDFKKEIPSQILSENKLFENRNLSEVGYATKSC